ncbi:MAG: ABC transporter substrate-binding protein [Clostridia bacterium]|nr:ABC transporter substrate-binding protein [Clostridia bacterium]
MKHRIRISALIVAVLIFLMTGCANRTENTSENDKIEVTEEKLTPEYGGTLRLACFVPDTLNPLATEYQNVREVLMIIYEGLFKAESTLKATPVLAESYTVSTSNKIYTIKLKQNVTFHDGSKFDSEDVIATFNYIREFPTPYSKMFENVLSYSAIDSSTVSLELISPQHDFVNNLDFPILPAGLAKESFVSENPDFVPVGTGKFKYENQIRNKYMTCSKAENIHDGKEVYIEQVQVKFLHNSQDIFHAFDAGEIDMFTTNGSNWGEFSFTSGVKSYESGSPRYTYLGINVKNPHLQDAALRRDMNRIINKKAMVEAVIFSHATPAELPIISTAYYNKQKESSQGESAVNTLQTQLPINEEDILEAPVEKNPDFNKYNISLYLLYNSESKEKLRAAQHLKKCMEPYGITLELQGVGFEDYKTRIFEENYDLYIGETIMNNNMNIDFMFNSLQKSEQNLCNFTNDQFDTLLNNIDMMAPESENSEIAYRNFTEYFTQNMPQIPLFHTNTAIFVSNRIKGGTAPSMSFFYSNIEDFFINYH